MLTVMKLILHHVKIANIYHSKDQPGMQQNRPMTFGDTKKIGMKVVHRLPRHYIYLKKFFFHWLVLFFSVD